MKRVLILTEAGQNIGYGHLMRCRALQDYFVSQGIETLVLLNYFGDIQCKGNNSIRFIDWLIEIEEVVKYSNIFEFVIIDSYLAPVEYYEFLKSNFGRVIAIDDYNRIEYPVDLLLNTNIYGDSLDYSNQHARTVGGSQYVILRESIKNGRNTFKINDFIGKVLVMFGGSDYRGIMPGLIESIYKDGYSIIAVAGSDEYKKRLLALLPKSDRIKIAGFADDNEMVKLFTEIDVAITAAGQTLNELAYLGIPAISVCIDKDQFLNIKTYHERGFLLDLICWDDKELKSKILEQLNNIKKTSLRIKLSETGRTIVNGTGKENILNLFKTL